MFCKNVIDSPQHVKKKPPIIANFFYHINVVYKVFNKYASTQKERNKTFYLNTNHLFQEC